MLATENSDNIANKNRKLLPDVKINKQESYTVYQTKTAKSDALVIDTEYDKEIFPLKFKEKIFDKDLQEFKNEEYSNNNVYSTNKQGLHNSFDLINMNGCIVVEPACEPSQPRPRGPG